MTPQIALVLTLLVLTLVLFPLEIISVDIIALSGLLLLIAFGILSPEQAFASFGSEMMLLLGSIFVIAGALMKTGMLDSMGLYLYRHCGGSYRTLIVSIILIVCCISAFMNNTVVTAVFLPAVMAIARRAKLPPSKLLIPLAFASMLGGTCTLIGTSTNVAASNLLRSRGMQPFGLFEFLPVGLAIVAGGTLYFLIAGTKLLPSRGGGELTQSYHVKDYLTEAAIRKGCPFLGKRIDEAGFQETAGVTLLGIIRAKETLMAPEGHEVLQANDILLLEAQVEGIHRFRQNAGVEIKGDVALGDQSLESATVKLVEVMIGPSSRFLGRTLKEIDFRRRYGLTALAVSRLGRDVVEKVGKIPLLVGDVLLVQGPEARLNDLRETANVLVLGDLSHFLLQRGKGIYVVTFFVIALVLGALDVLSLGTAVLGAAILTILARAVPGEEVYRLIDWRLMMMIGGMTGFGQAMVTTGADRYLANIVMTSLGGLGTHGILAGFFILTVALSQPLSNAASALAVLPIALAAAEGLGANPRTFAVVITIAASASFMTPLEPSCVLVYTPGRYRFMDFLKVGLPLTLVVMVIVLSLVPVIWKL